MEFQELYNNRRWWQHKEETQARKGPWTDESEDISIWKKTMQLGFPGGAVVESLPANAGDTGSSPGLGRSHMPRSN